MRRITSLGVLALTGLGVAVVWSMVVVIGAFTVPVYSGESVSSDGGPPVATSATLVAENGLGSAFVVAVPLLVALLVGVFLALVPWPAGRVVAWILTGLLGAFTLLAMMTIGIFLLPVTVGLVVACAGSRQPQPACAS